MFNYESKKTNLQVGACTFLGFHGRKCQKKNYYVSFYVSKNNLFILIYE